MKQEDKELLLRDLCARLPYRPIVRVLNKDGVIRNVPLSSGNIAYVEKLEKDWWTECKPYLRPMSSMTWEERKYLQKLPFPYDFVDWLNAHHFDYRGLIEKGLALEAQKGMYNIKEK